ncbi:MAG TPA: class I SAM-dependent methyltransferase [Coleofasciculaceae cyanobacterium]
MHQNSEFPDWEKLYQDKPVESMPWFNPDLDPDLDQALNMLNIHTGTVLDLGTGPGTQAMALAEKGFKVTATDLSATAIAKAQSHAQEKGLDIVWKQDDILNSTLNSEKFDVVFDRGCFHVFPPERRQDYVRVVANLVKSNSYLFLKCFSYLEQREGGPHRFTPEEIRNIFSNQFNMLSVEDTVYHGTLSPLPRALFCVLQKS